MSDAQILYERLVKEFAEKLETRELTLLAGNMPDFAHYQREVGRREGLVVAVESLRYIWGQMSSPRPSASSQEPDAGGKSEDGPVY